MVAFSDGEEDILFVVGGWSVTSSSTQLGSECEKAIDPYYSCNEQHMFTLNTSK